MNVHLYPTILKNETRILKIAFSLRRHGVFNEVAIVGRYCPGLPAYENIGDNIHLYRLKSFLSYRFESGIGKAVRTVFWYFSVFFWVRARSVECLNCHSLPILPLSVFIKWFKCCKLVYDTHELETETHGTRGIRKNLAKWIEKALVKSADAVCVVNASIGDWYEKSYCLPRAWVVRNLPRRITTAPERAGELRRLIGLETREALLFIYQGLLSPGRGIEMLIELFARESGSRHLVFMGYGPLEGLILQKERLFSRIHFLPAVPPDQVFKYTVDADIGFSLIENTCLSYYLCAPNKLYEYAACGVPAIVSDFPEMSQFVESNDCGWKTALGIEPLRNLLDSIDINTLAEKRKNAIRAGVHHCWENEEPELLRMYEYLGLYGSKCVLMSPP
jgi:glycosyltransferase involved in cell wall biosynthesis